MKICQENCHKLLNCHNHTKFECPFILKKINPEAKSRYIDAVMENDGEIVGFVSYSIQTTFVKLLAVSTQHYSQGYGAELLSHAERQIKLGGGEWVKLFITPRNTRAAKFYRRQGYRSLDESLFTKQVV